MDAIINQITANKPDIKNTTAVNYYKYLLTLKNKMIEKTAPITIEMFADINATMNAMKESSPTQKKNFAVALRALHPELYIDICKQMCDESRGFVASDEHRQQSKIKNEMNATEIDEIRVKLEKGFMDAVKQIKISATYLHNHLQEMQKWVLFSLYFTDGLAPRRALDYLQMKFRNYTPDENYVDIKKKMFIYNHFKTSKLRGCQQNYVPEKLLKLIKTYIKYIPDGIDTLLFKANGQPLETSNLLTLKLNEIFGEGKGVNAIRHHYLTTKYADTIKNYENLCDDMDDMGSSIGSVRSYIID